MIEERFAPPAQRCGCGADVRVVLYRGRDLIVEADPLPGGPLIVNVDRVVLHQGSCSSGLGFRQHLCLDRYV